MPQQQFKGYSEDQMKRIASKLGHTGDLDTLDGYLQGNPNAMGKYNSLNDAVTKRYAVGGDVTTDPIKNPDIINPTQSVTPEGIAFNKDSTVGDISLAQSLTPRLPTGGVATAVKTATSADQSVDSTGTQVKKKLPS